MNLRELKAKRGEVIDSMTALDEQITSLEDVEEQTEEQAQELAEAREQFDALRGQKNTIEARIERQIDLNATSGIPDPVDGAGASGGESAGSGRGEQDYRSQYDSATPRSPLGPEAKKEFDSLGDWAFAVAHNPNDQRLEFRYNDMSAEQSMGEGSSGGFLVPDTFRDQLLSVDPQEAIVRPRATVFPPDPNRPDAGVEMPALDQSDDSGSHRMYGGVEVDWIGEGEEKTDTDASFRMIKWQPHEVAASLKVTDKILRNRAALEQFLLNQMRLALLANEDQQFTTGNGIAKPTGFIGHSSEYAQTRDTSDEVNYADIVNMFSRLLDGGQAIWLTNRSTIPQLTQITDDNGNIIWQPNAREGLPNTLLGLPVTYNHRSPTLGSKGDLVLCDLSRYVIADGSGPMMDIGFVNDDFKKNKRTLKIFKNVDGKPWLNHTVRNEDDREHSPFVVLAA